MTRKSSTAEPFAETTIGELIGEHGGSIKTGPFGTTLKAAEYSREGVPLISVGEIGYGTITVHDKTPRVSPLVTNRLPEYLLEFGDIVFGRKGAVDRSALVQREQAGWFLGSDGIRLRLPNGPNAPCDPVFIAYCLQEKQHRAWILQHATGTTMASLNQGIIERVPIPLPPLPEQRAIAAVLGALDDKIEVNRKTARVLEGIARAVFTSWFVDFDPVRRHPHAAASAKAPAAPTAPTLPRPLADLFPTRLVDSAIGEVPEGWRASRWSDVVTLEYGKSLRGYEDVVGAFRVYGTNGPIGWHTEYLWPSEGIVIGRKGAYRGVHYSAEPFFVIDTAFYVKPTKPLSMKWAYFSLLTHDINAMDSGSAIPSTSREAFYALPVVVPPQELMTRFEDLAAPLFVRSRLATRQSEWLAALRDTLLPKLISGELRIADAEKIVGRAV
jgi:type I restriction enzyme S subunit